MINEMLISKEEMDAIRRKEKLRKEGETFFRVFNYGPEGFNFIHAIEDVTLVPYEDPETGRVKHEKRIGSSTLNFKEDLATGEMVADVLDTEFNRFFISRHLELVNKDGSRTTLFEVESKKIAREIKALVNKEYVVEPSKKQNLRRKIVEMERELTKIRHQEEKEKKDEREEEMSAGEKIKIVKQKPEKEPEKQPVLDAPEAGV